MPDSSTHAHDFFPGALPTSGRMVVVVEDNPEFQELIAEAIRGLGEEWETLNVSSGAEASALFDTGSCRPELVLVDIGLPDVSGIDVIRDAHRRFPDKPIMVISVIASHDSVIKAIEAGARGYLQKGDSLISITDAVKLVLAGDYLISPALARHLFRLVDRGAGLANHLESPLTVKEITVLKLLGEGYTYLEASSEMHVAVSTLQYHVKNIYQKLHVNSRAKAIAKATAQGWI